MEGNPLVIPDPQAVDEGVESIVMFTDEWVSAHQSGPGEGLSRQIGDDLPNLTLDSREVGS